MGREIRLEDVDLDRVQALAQLELEPDEREQLLVDLRRILHFAAEMGEVGDDVPGESPSPGSLRAGDMPASPMRVWTENVPRWRGGWFVVPDRPAEP